MQSDRLAADGHAARVGYQILPVQHIGQTRQGHAVCCHFGAGNLDIDLFRQDTADGDLTDAGHQHQFPAQLFRVFTQFGIAKVVAINREKIAVHIAEIIVHKRRADTGRKLQRGVIDASAQFIPDLRQFGGVIAGIDIDGDLR